MGRGEMETECKNRTGENIHTCNEPAVLLRLLSAMVLKFCSKKIPGEGRGEMK